MSEESDESGFRAYFEHNREAILRDVSVALLWTGAIAFMVDQLDWPLWSFFTIYFGVWYIYLQAVPAWESLAEAEATNDS